MNDKLPLTSNVLFAGRRFFNSRDGSKQLVLVNLTTGERLEDSEEKLNVYGVNLGNFLSRTPSGGYQRVTTLQVQVSIEGNVAVIKKVPTKLFILNLGGAKVLESPIFGRAKGPDYLVAQEPSEFTVDFILRETPTILLNGWRINFDATNCNRSYRLLSSPPPPTPPRHGNGFSEFADLNTRPEDPLALLNRKDRLFAPINPPPQKHTGLAPLPDLDHFSSLALGQRLPSPAFSSDSQFLPKPPGAVLQPATPVPKPRSNTPLNVKGSPMSPIPHAQSKFLLAGGRLRNNGIAKLILVDPKTGKDNYLEEETVLEQAGISLGDWVRAKLTPGLGLSNYSKTSHTANLVVKAEGDVAYAANIRGLLIEDQGFQIFQNPLFANALCSVKMQPGKYFARISLLPSPVNLPDGSTFYFEATNLRPIVKQPPKFPPGDPNLKFKGAGFKHQDPPKPIAGAGFAMDPKPEPVIVGAGFTAPQPVKLRAVVMSFMDQGKARTHFLWILEKQAEGMLMDKMCQLEKGHFFEGTFKVNPNGKWTCQKYEKALEPLIQGGLDSNGTIWFKVKVEKFKAVSGNMKFAEAQAKYIGKIVDTEEMLTETCNGKLVKVQRKGVAKNDYVWSVVEVF